MSDVVRIARLGAQGDGIAEGEDLYVPFSLPGDTVRVRRFGSRAWPERVIDPAPDRVTPPCPHFTRCGGCALQHASGATVATWKTDTLRTTLAARGLVGVEIRPIVTTPPGSRRRITVAGRRTKKGVQVGFHSRGDVTVVPVEACPVAEPALVAVLDRLEELVRKGASRKGELRITLTLSPAGIDAAVTEAKDLSGPEMALLAGTATRAGLARLSWNGEVAVTISPPVQIFGRARVVPPPGGFLQPTLAGEHALLAAARDAVGPAARIADLFSGSGTFALALADEAEVLALESEGPAIEALEAGWRGCPGLKTVRAIRRDLFNRPLRPAEMKGLDAAIMNPPRAGARAQAEQIAAGGPQRIAYVSCNPATFARDAQLLVEGGYALDWVQPVDQFRWSPHLELVGAFSRR